MASIFTLQGQKLKDALSSEDCKTLGGYADKMVSEKGILGCQKEVLDNWSKRHSAEEYCDLAVAGQRLAAIQPEVLENWLPRHGFGNREAYLEFLKKTNNVPGNWPQPVSRVAAQEANYIPDTTLARPALDGTPEENDRVQADWEAKVAARSEEERLWSLNSRGALKEEKAKRQLAEEAPKSSAPPAPLPEPELAGAKS